MKVLVVMSLDFYLINFPCWRAVKMLESYFNNVLLMNKLFQVSWVQIVYEHCKHYDDDDDGDHCDDDDDHDDGSRSRIHFIQLLGFVKWRNEKSYVWNISHKMLYTFSWVWILSTPTLKIIPILRWLMNSPLGLDIHWHSRSRIFEAISNGSSLLVEKLIIYTGISQVKKKNVLLLIFFFLYTSDFF